MPEYLGSLADTYIIIGSASIILKCMLGHATGLSKYTVLYCLTEDQMTSCGCRPMAMGPEANTLGRGAVGLELSRTCHGGNAEHPGRALGCRRAAEPCQLGNSPRFGVSHWNNGWRQCKSDWLPKQTRELRTRCGCACAARRAGVCFGMKSGGWCAAAHPRSAGHFDRSMCCLHCRPAPTAEEAP